MPARWVGRPIMCFWFFRWMGSSEFAGISSPNDGGDCSVLFSLLLIHELFLQRLTSLLRIFAGEVFLLRVPVIQRHGAVYDIADWVIRSDHQEIPVQGESTENARARSLKLAPNPT